MTKNGNPTNTLPLPLLDLIYAFHLGGPQIAKLKADSHLYRRAMDMMEQNRTERAEIMLRRAGII